MSAADHGLAAMLALLSLSLLFQKLPDVPKVRRTFYVAGAVTGIGAATIVLAFWAMQGRPIPEFGFFDWWGDPSLTAVAMLGWAVLLLIGLVLVQLGWFEAKLRKIYARYDKLMPRNGRELAASWGTSIAAGCGEEIAYRGFLFWYGAIWVGWPTSLVVTSLLFGVAHGYQSRFGVIYATIAGLSLGGLYVLTGSLILAMWVHATYNMASFTTGLLLLRLAQDQSSPPDE